MVAFLLLKLITFSERRKIERSIRRLEKMQRIAADSPDENSARQIADIAEQLADLKEDLEYVRVSRLSQLIVCRNF
jgi:ribosomal protein L18E